LKRYLFLTFIGMAIMLVSLNNHPTLTLNLFATGVFILCADVGERVSSRERQKPALRYVLFVAAACVGGGVAAATIGLAYDAAIGPDPRRFSLMSNIMMDSIIVGFIMLLLRAMQAFSHRDEQ
jgi:hypothetical protein